MEIEREIELAAAPEEVWQQLVDDESLGEWLEADVELDVRPGGAGSFRFADGEVRRAMVREADPAQRLAFTWWPLTGTRVGVSTTVVITIEPLADGSRLRLVETTAVSTGARVRAAA
jgi:uncharacterized protein YndB with AHSA1/START domain